MNSETALITAALAVSAASGAVADAVKKQIFHAHGIDWRLLVTLAEALRIEAEALRIEAATLALLAEREINGQQGLSNVTLGPDFDALLGDRLPGDVAEGDVC